MKLFWYLIEIDIHWPRTYRIARASFVIFFMWFVIDMHRNLDHLSMVDDVNLKAALDYTDKSAEVTQSVIEYYHD